jgi:hypothetical protein
MDGKDDAFNHLTPVAAQLVLENAWIEQLEVLLRLSVRLEPYMRDLPLSRQILVTDISRAALAYEHRQRSASSDGA